MNLGEAKDRVLKLIREYTNKGVAITDDDNADYLMSMNDLFDISQKEIATSNKMILKKAKFIRRDYDGLEVEDGTHYTEDISYECTNGKAFYFELLGTATVYIEEYVGGVWSILDTITGDYYGEAFKGNIATTSDTVRIRFSGSYVYEFKNVKIYINPFPSDYDVPDNGEYISFQLPSNYYMVHRVLLDGEAYGEYQRDTESMLKNIIFPSGVYGLFEVQYFAYPETISGTTTDSYEFEVSDDAVQCMIYYVAYMSKLDEDAFFASEMKETYYLKLNALQQDHSEGFSKVINTTRW